MRIDTRGIVRGIAQRLEGALAHRLQEVRDIIDGLDDDELQTVEAVELLRIAHRKLDPCRTSHHELRPPCSLSVQRMRGGGRARSPR